MRTLLFIIIVLTVSSLSTVIAQNYEGNYVLVDSVKSPSDAFFGGSASRNFELIAIGPYVKSDTSNLSRRNLVFYDSTGRKLAEYNVGNSAWAVAMNPSGTRTAVGSDDEWLYLFSGTTLLAKGRPIPGNAQIRGVAVSNDGRYVGAGGAAFTLHDLTKSNPIDPIYVDRMTVQCRAMDFSGDGRFVAYGGWNNNQLAPRMYVAIYDLHRSQRVFADSIDYSTPTTNAELRHLAISPNGNRLLIGNWAGYVIYYSRTDTNASWRRRQSVSINSRIYWTDMDSAGTLVVVGNQERGLQLYSLADTTMTMLWETGTPELQIPLDGGQRTVSMTPNGELMNCTTRGGGMGGGRMVVLKRSGERVFNRAIHAIRDQTIWTSPNGVSPELWFGRVSADGSRIVFAGWSGYAYFYKLKDLIPPNLTSPSDGAANIALNTSLSWASVSSATSYTLQVSTRTDFSAFTVNQSGITSTSYALTGLSAGTEYFWRVSAENATTTSGFSVTRRFRTVIAPGAPQNLIVFDSSSTKIGIKWRKTTEPDFLRYRIYRDTSPNAATKVDSSTANPSDTSKAFTGLTNGTKYYLRVTAVDSAGNESAYSNEVSATPRDYVAPSAPQNLAVTDSSSRTITTKWRKNTEIDFLRYRIYQGTSPAPTTRVDSTSGGISDTSKTFTGLANGTRYYFRVTAVDSTGNESSYSNEVNASSGDRIAPAAPAGIVITDSSSKTITIKWKRNTESDFLRYRIYRATSANPTTKVDSTSGGITDTAKTFTALTNGTRYYFRVTAVDSAGNESAYSNEVNVVPADRIPPAAPTNLVVVDTSSTKIGIKWRKTTEPDFLRYRIYRATSPNPTTKVDSATAGVTDTSKTFTGMTNGTRYYLRVTAVDSAGNESAYSNEVSGVPNASVAVEGLSNQIPTEYSLAQNYPNPFNPSTTLHYGLPMNSRVKLQVYNVLGQVVAELVNGEQIAGWHREVWNANVSTGLYFYRIEAVSTNDPNNRFLQVKKMMLLK